MEWDKKAVGVCFVVLSLLLALPVVAKVLVTPGVPLNADLSVWYGVWGCIVKAGSIDLPGVWCSNTNMGFAHFQFYGPFLFHVMQLVHVIFSAEFAFKFALLLVWVSVPCAVFALLRSLRYPLAAGLVFGFILLEEGGGSRSFGRIFLNGSFANPLGDALLFAMVVCCWNFLENPSRRRMILMAVLGSMYALTHISTFVITVPVLVGCSYVMAKESVQKSWRWWLFLLALWVMIPAYYTVPLGLNAGLYKLKELGATQIFKSFSVWGLSHVWWTMLAITFCCVLWKRREPRCRVIPLMIASLGAVWVIGGAAEYWGALFFPPVGRLNSIFFYVGVMGLGVCLEQVWEISRRECALGERAKRWRWEMFIAGVFMLASGVMIGQGVSLFYTSRGLVFSSDERFMDAKVMGAQMNGIKGRVLVEDTYGGWWNATERYAVYQKTHVWAASALFTDAEVIGAGDRWSIKYDFSETQQGRFFDAGMPIHEAERYGGYADLLDISKVVYFSPYYGRSLNDKRVVGEGGFFKMGEGAPDASYFGLLKEDLNVSGQVYKPKEFEGVGVVESSYEKVYARAVVDLSSRGYVVFKVRYWPNWVAFVNGKPTRPEQGPVGLMGVWVPAGRHVIEWRFVPLLEDRIAAWMTVAGLILAGWCIVRRSKEKTVMSS